MRLANTARNQSSILLRAEDGHQQREKKWEAVVGDVNMKTKINIAKYRDVISHQNLITTVWLKNQKLINFHSLQSVTIAEWLMAQPT